MQKNTWVICDRFADSSRVYQGIIGGVNNEILESVIHFSTEGLTPDLTLLLDCPVEISSSRVLSDRSSSRNEQGAKRFDDASLAFHSKIRQGFLNIQLANPDRVKLIDASKSHEEVLQQSIEQIEKKLFS